jgi:kynurenine formamidase
MGVPVDRRELMRTTAAGVAGAVGGSMFGAAESAGAGTVHGRGGRGPQLIFLSHVNDPATTTLFPGDPDFTLEVMATVPVDGFYMQYVREGEHTGTHWGAPGHFQAGGLLADQLDPGDFFLPAVRIDVRAKAAADPDYGVTVDDVRRWTRRHGRIPRGSAVILWTGWEDRWGTDAYANVDGDGVIHQPGFLPETVEWLIETRALDERGALGTDTFGPDRGIDETFGASIALYDRHRISLENLTNLGALPSAGASVLVGGPRNAAGSGSTATIFGVLPG